jgi:hypothetical protein
VAGAAKLSADVKCTDAPCFRTWATGFLLQAFRTPVSGALLDRYAAMLTSNDAGANLTERLTTFLSAALSSPHFLYRKELGTAAVGGDATLRSLDAYEIASRLSYTLWQGPPDAELLAAAGKGDLLQPAARLAQMERLLKDSRARLGLRAFVADWMGLFENHLSKKLPEILAGTGTDFPDVAHRAFDMLVDDVLASGAGTRFADLLQVEHAFANASMAKVLGTSGGGADLQRVTPPANERRGILMQPVVIGAHSKESGASPFPMGKFIFENVLCEVIPPVFWAPAMWLCP